MNGMPNDSLDSKSDELSIELLLVIMSSSFSTEPKTLVGKMSRLALLKRYYYFLSQYLLVGIVGSVVECSPATRAARVRFPDDA